MREGREPSARKIGLLRRNFEGIGRTTGPSRPGRLPTRGSHRFRTCPIKASGSSSHGRPRASGASPALRSGGVTVTGARVSVHPPCCPPTGRDSALPSLHRVPAGRVPLLQRYYEVLRRPAADPAALRCSFAWPYLPVRLCSLPTDPTPARGLELWNWQPHARNCGKATTGPLRFLGNPPVHMPCSSTPAGPTRQDIRRSRRGPRIGNDEGSREFTVFRGSIARPLHSLSTLRPGDCSTRTQDSLPAAVRSTGRDWLPAGFQRKVATGAWTTVT